MIIDLWIALGMSHLSTVCPHWWLRWWRSSWLFTVCLKKKAIQVETSSSSSEPTEVMIPSVFDKIQVSLFSTSVLKIFKEGLVIISKVFVSC